ncbi:sigma-70 family RNA polymerase sigma factor [Nocardia brasiliensis]|uniref:sigma-70 family RNA polymerase sigma factor n=1 Tax=Nocardia brasiliensis TaxID=37326 RepID=UPI002453AA28|nr:sigma-70 family RNA polymerase sigma factor [Nocardia brasiliensis]
MPEEPKLTAIRLRRTGGDGGPSCPPRVDPEEAALTRRLLGLLAAVAARVGDPVTQVLRGAPPPGVGGGAGLPGRPHAAAEEITQEVYLQVWSLAAGYDRKLSSPMGWLMMLTHRRAVDRVRREQSAATRDIAYGQAHLGRDHDVVAEEVGQRFDEQSVLDCLDTLTEIQRQAVALAYYSGRTYSEVADHLAVPLPTVKSRIRDGLKRLENCLTGSDTR